MTTNETKRVAITGLGAVTGLGLNGAAFDAALRNGKSGIGTIARFDTDGMRTPLGAQVDGETLDAQLGKTSPELLRPTVSRPDRFGIAAARQAAAQAGLSADDLRAAAVVFGTGTGGARETERFISDGKSGASPPAWLLVPHQPASVTDLVARDLGIEGPRNTIMTACSSSATAIGHAADLVRLGRVTIALGGGAEGLCRLTCAGFSALRATSPEWCRPFDAERKGLNLGEGAAVLVLEEWQHAVDRGATILGELVGWGTSADAHHMTAPHPEGDGAARAMQAGLRDARLVADAVDYVNAHGTATPHNDAAETLALKTVLGARAPSVPISSIKSMVGHTLGAAGAIEAVASVLSLVGGFVPPTVNLHTPDPAFGLDYVPGEARPATLKVIVSNSFAFGGNNTSLVFRRTPRD